MYQWETISNRRSSKLKYRLFENEHMEEQKIKKIPTSMKRLTCILGFFERYTHLVYLFSAVVKTLVRILTFHIAVPGFEH